MENGDFVIVFLCNVSITLCLLLFLYCDFMLCVSYVV